MTAHRPAGAGGGDSSHDEMTADMSSTDGTWAIAGLSQRVTDSSPKTVQRGRGVAVVQGRSTSRGVRMVAPSMLTRCGELAIRVSANREPRTYIPGRPMVRS